MRLTWNQWHKKVQSWNRKFPGAVKKAIDRALVEMVGEAQRTHLSGPKMPRGIGDRLHGTLQPRTGQLRNHMGKKSEQGVNKIRGWLTNNIKYAAVHEYGKTIVTPNAVIKMPERPFARPAVEAKRERLRKHIREEVLKAYGN